MTARRVDVTRAASIIVVCGSSGSGKSAWVKQRIAKARRVLVWDVDDEYEGFERITAPVALVDALRSASAGRFAFVAPVKAFDLWTRAAFAWGNCTVVAEELAGVTTPGKAPPGWHQLVSRGRKRGIEVIGVTQRPSESDKTIMGNATLIHCCMLSRRQDRAYMSQELDAPELLLSKLEPLQWIEKKRGTKEVSMGRMRFPSR